MKTKNVILGLAAFVFAIGSAFTSSLSAPPDYISVKYQGDADFTCEQINESCDGQGTQLCQVVVTTITGPQNARVFDNNTNPTLCADELHDGAGIVGEWNEGLIVEVR